MLQTSESETEILLGNKQLLGIFIVIAVLVGVAFTGGYFVGRSAGIKNTTASTLASATGATGTGASETAGATNSGTPNSVAETRTIAPDSSQSDTTPTGEVAGMPPASSASDDDAPARSARVSDQKPLGSPKRASAKKIDAEVVIPASAEFAPQTGQSFLQVAAVKRDEAEAVADELHKKGFHAHAVPKPGSATIYRILIGPVKDAGDLSATRDLLRKTGFREVIVQRY